MPLNLKALELIATQIRKPLSLSIQGPFTLAVELVGATDFVRAIIRNPDFIEKVLDFTNQVVSDYARATVNWSQIYLYFRTYRSNSFSRSLREDGSCSTTGTVQQFRTRGLESVTYLRGYPISLAAYA